MTLADPSGRSRMDVRTFMQNLVQGKENNIETKNLAIFKSYFLADPEPAAEIVEPIELPPR